jgi:hypothetical protein
MKLYALPNLSAKHCSEIEPWVDPGKTTVPKLADKPAYSKWAKDPTTNWCFLSPFEGQIRGERVSASNPPAFMRAVIVDYDVPLSDEEGRALGATLAKQRLRPAIVHATFSGNLRLIYLFENPHQVDARSAEALLKLISQKLGLKRLSPGMDDCFFKPEQVYAFWAWDKEGGLDLSVNLGNTIPDDTVLAWKSEVLGKLKYDADGPALDIGQIAAEVERLFPGRWEGSFEVGARGCRFWDSSADNDTACLVRENGMTCFTGDVPFKPWGAIFGGAFVSGLVEARFGAAVKNVYFDGEGYWRRVGRTWSKFNESSVKLDLMARGLGVEVLKGETMSELQRALHLIQTSQFTAGQAPSIYGPETFFMHGARRLNSATATALQPSSQEDLDSEGFPILSELLYTMFVNDKGPQTEGEDDYEHFMCNLARAYRGALEGRPLLGHVIALVGPVQSGKSFLAHKVMGGLLGECVAADNYLNGEEQFNDYILEAGVAAIDDGMNHTSARSLNRFTQRMKQLTASPHQLYNGKYKKPIRVEWRGRMILCANDDVESLRSLPDLTVNSLDKISIYRVYRPLNGGAFPTDDDLARELPRLARSLLTMKHPRRFEEDHRYGIRSYQNPIVAKDARASSAADSGGMAELLEILFSRTKETITAKSTTEIIGLFTTHLGDVFNPNEWRREKVGTALTHLAVTRPDAVQRKNHSNKSVYYIDREAFKPMTVGEMELARTR